MAAHVQPSRLRGSPPRALLIATLGLAALCGLGTWLIVDRAAGDTAPTDAAAALIDRSCSAISGGDRAGVASLYAPGAVLTRDDGGRTTGAEAIAALVPQTTAIRFRIWRTAPVTVSGEFATTFMRYTSTLRSGTELGVFQLRGGKILRQWIFRLGTTPPFDETAA